MKLFRVSWLALGTLKGQNGVKPALRIKIRRAKKAELSFQDLNNRGYEERKDPKMQLSKVTPIPRLISDAEIAQCQ